MDSMSDKEFEEFLKMRSVPDAPSNLAHRIIEASKQPQEKSQVGVLDGLREFLGGVAGSFEVPKPAFILAGLVMLVFAGGVFGVFSLEPGEISSEIYAAYDEGDDVSLAFYVDDIFEI